MTEFTERRPYNAVSDFVDANVARGVGDKVAFDDGVRVACHLYQPGVGGARPITTEEILARSPKTQAGPAGGAPS